MPRGVIKFFNENRGYGFIESTDSAEVFVHHSQIAEDGYRTLREGDQVSFELRDGNRGPEAVNVHRLT